MDTLKSVWEDLNDRLKSPFIISFIISWSLWNWELLYTLFNFDPGTYLDDKTHFIETYLNDHYWRVSIIPLLTSVVAAGIFYGGKLVFLWLDAQYENKLRIKVIEWVGISKMVPKSDLERYVNEIARYRKEIDEKDSLYSSSLTTIDTLRIENTKLKEESPKIKELSENIHKLQFTNSELIKENSTLRTKKSEIPFLDHFFANRWFCEYHLIQINSVQRGLEEFYIKRDEYRLKNDSIGFYIKNIVFDSDLRALSFIKEVPGAPRKTNEVYLFSPIDKNYWIGYERTWDKNFAYICFYEKDASINNYLFAVTKEAIHSQNQMLQEIRDTINALNIK